MPKHSHSENKTHKPNHTDGDLIEFIKLLFPMEEKLTHQELAKIAKNILRIDAEEIFIKYLNRPVQQVDMVFFENEFKKYVNDAQNFIPPTYLCKKPGTLLVYVDRKFHDTFLEYAATLMPCINSLKAEQQRFFSKKGFKKPEDTSIIQPKTKPSADSNSR